MKKKLPVISRYLLGLIFFVFGLNGFLMFLPMPPPKPEMAKLFEGIMSFGYLLPLVKGIEVVAGAMLLLDLFVPIVLIFLSPIVVNIFLVHAFHEPDGLIMAVAIVVMMVILGKAYFNYFASLFTKKASL